MVDKTLDSLTQNNIDISFIIPVFNTAKYLEECVESIVNNNHHKELGYTIEIILVDDGSTDDSCLIGKRLEEKYDYLHFYKIDHSGPGISRNIGLEKSRGAYVWFIDSDDYLINNIVDLMYDVVSKDDVDYCCCNVFRHNGKKITPTGHLKAFSKISVDKKVLSLSDQPELVYDSVTWNKLIKKQFLIDNAIKYENKDTYEDVLMSLKLLHKANRIGFLRTRGYVWRIRNDKSNLSITDNVKEINNLNNKVDAIIEEFNYFQNIAQKEAYYCFQERCIISDFVTYLDAIPLLDKENGNKYIDKIAIVFEKLDKDIILPRISPIYRQIYHDVLNHDYDNLVKVINYKNHLFKQAEILDDKFILPNDIFKDVDLDIIGYFKRNVPGSRIYDIEYQDNILIIYVYLYFNRISLPKPESQEVVAYLVNDVSKQSILLKTSVMKTDFLTNENGIVVSYYTLKNNQYNYDYAGIRIEIDLSKLLSTDGFEGNNLVLLNYNHQYYNGNRILRGMPEIIKKRLKSLSYQNQDKTINIDVDLSSTLQIISKSNSKQSDKSILNDFNRKITNINDLNKATKSLDYDISDLAIDMELINKTLLQANNEAAKLLDKKTKIIEKDKEKIESLNKQLSKEKEKRIKAEKKANRERRSWNWRIGYIVTYIPKKLIKLLKKLVKIR